MIAFLRRLRYVGEVIPAGPGGLAAFDWIMCLGYLVESSAGEESRELVTHMASSIVVDTRDAVTP